MEFLREYTIEAKHRTYEMRRVIYLITRSERGGAQSHLVELLGNFRRDFELHLATDEEGWLTRVATDLGSRVHLVRNLVAPVRPARDAAALTELVRMIREIGPNLIHAHSSKAGILARLAAGVAGIRSVFTAHGWAFTGGAPLARRLVAVASERFAGRFGDRIIAVSENDRRLAIRYRIAAPERVVTIRNGIADTQWRSSPASPGAPVLIMVARFAAQKDFEQLIAASAAISQPHRLLLVGDGPLRPRAEALVRSLGATDRVAFTGDSDSVPQLLADSHVFVLATNWEGLPISILEAMRAGLPVVASDVGGVSEAVIEGETGLLVPRGDRSSLRAALTRLIGDAELRARLGAAGRRRYEKEFTAERMIRETRAVYEDVLRGSQLQPFSIAAD